MAVLYWAKVMFYSYTFDLFNKEREKHPWVAAQDVTAAVVDVNTQTTARR